MSTQSIYGWAKDNGTYYSVVQGWIKRGIVPPQLIGKNEKGKWEIADKDEMTAWYKQYQNGEVETRNVARAKVDEYCESALGYVAAVTEGQFTKRDVPIRGTNKKRVHVTRVDKVTPYLIYTDDGLQRVSDPWTHGGFDENHVITTPKAIIKLLQKEYTCRERNDVVEALDKVMELIKEDKE